MMNTSTTNLLKTPSKISPCQYILHFSFSNSLAKLKGDGLDDLDEIGDVSPDPKKLKQQFQGVPVKTKNGGGGGGSSVVIQEVKSKKEDSEYSEDEDYEDSESDLDEEEDDTRASKEKSKATCHCYRYYRNCQICARCKQ